MEQPFCKRIRPGFLKRRLRRVASAIQVSDRDLGGLNATRLIPSCPVQVGLPKVRVTPQPSGRRPHHSLEVCLPLRALFSIAASISARLVPSSTEPQCLRSATETTASQTVSTTQTSTNSAAIPTPTGPVVVPGYQGLCPRRLSFRARVMPRAFQPAS